MLPDVFMSSRSGLRAEAVGAFFGGGKAAEKKVRNAVARVSGRRRLDGKMALPLLASTEDLLNANE